MSHVLLILEAVMQVNANNGGAEVQLFRPPTLGVLWQVPTTENVWRMTTFGDVTRRVQS
jgi:hypothetical protein